MTRDRARKKAIRARMAASGEPYSAAARELSAATPIGDSASHSIDDSASRSVDDSAVADEVIARANATLAAPQVRIEIRMDRDITWSHARPQRRPPGPVARLARAAAEAAWKRISPEMDLASVGEEFKQRFRHLTGEGFLEPSGERYQIDFGGYAEMRCNGQYYGGGSGQPLRANNRQKPPDPSYEPLEVIKKLRQTTDARLVGHETVHGTPCRVVAARVDSAEFTIWLDDEHIRRIRSEWTVSGEHASGSTIRTFDLWDFGVADPSADWTRLPNFRAAAGENREPAR